MKLIPLTLGYDAIVDDEDFELLSFFKWHVQIRSNGTRLYAMRVSRKGEAIKKTKFYMHRLLMKAPKEMMVDHINHNGLDNRKINLRIVTPTQNQGNRRKLTVVKSKFKGVRPTKWGSFRCSVRCKKKSFDLGTFKTEEEAARKYDEYAKKYFGEFSQTNL